MSGASECPGPDRCCDDLCRGNDFGVCGKPSDRMLGIDDDEHDAEEDEYWECGCGLWICRDCRPENFSEATS